MIRMFNHIGLNAQFEIHGYILSVYVGAGSDSESKKKDVGAKQIISNNAEIALMNKEEEYILPNQTVGYQSAEAIARAMHVMLTKHDTDESLVSNILAVLD